MGGTDGTYRFVLIEDLSQPTDEPASADIDAVLLYNGNDLYVTGVQSYMPGPNVTAGADDETQIIGEKSAALFGGCEAGDEGFVSLGGSPGYIVVEFEESVEIATGDVLTVVECGHVGAFPQAYRVAVGTDPDPTAATWVDCPLDDPGGPQSAPCIIPDLP